MAQCYNGNNVTLTGETAEATCHCGKVCKNIRGLRIHQLRTQCGQAGTQIQRTIVTTVGETAENFNQYQHHSIEALSETDTMHASTMNLTIIQEVVTETNHQILSYSYYHPRLILPLLPPMEELRKHVLGNRRSNDRVPSPPKNGRN